MTTQEEGSVGSHLDHLQSPTKEVEMHKSLKMNWIIEHWSLERKRPLLFQNLFISNILVIPCLVTAAHCSSQSVSTLDVSFDKYKPSVKFERVMVLRNLGSGSSVSSTAFASEFEQERRASAPAIGIWAIRRHPPLRTHEFARLVLYIGSGDK